MVTMRRDQQTLQQNRFQLSLDLSVVDVPS